MKTQLSIKDIMQFWATIYFNPKRFDDDGLIEAAINRAYRDLNRTIHGLGKAKAKAGQEGDDSDNTTKVHVFVSAQIKSFLNGDVTSPFDEWHNQVCSNLVDRFNNTYFLNTPEDKKFHYGQAQKWINMSLKYIYLLHRSSLLSEEKKGIIIDETYPLWHVPVDNIIQKKSGIKLSGQVPWSRIEKEEYLNFQRQFKDKYQNQNPKPIPIPMDAEFELFKKTLE